jgi:hypothetical protein
MFENVPWRIGLIALVLAVVDIYLLMQYYGTDSDSELPRSDFKRLNHWSPQHRKEAALNPLQQSETSEEEECNCDPLAEPSTMISCYLNEHGSQQVKIANSYRVTNLKFTCDKVGEDGCQCCDCGSESKTFTFNQSMIAAASMTCDCEHPKKHGWYSHGQLHQMLFLLPLDLRYDATSFEVDLVVEGDFTQSTDNDVLIGVVDWATKTTWVAQRGDNGLWFFVGNSQRVSMPVTAEQLGANGGNTTSAVSVVERIPHISVFDGQVMKYIPRGSRAGKFGLRIMHDSSGEGQTRFEMDNNLIDNHGRFQR